MQKSNTPIALVESVNEGNASRYDDEVFGLVSRLFLCVGAKVLLTKNYLKIGLSNSSAGVIKELVYEGENVAPALPKFDLVDFGHSRAGESFFPNDPGKKDGFLFVQQRILHAVLISELAVDLLNIQRHNCR